MDLTLHLFKTLEFVGIFSFAVNAMILAGGRGYSVLGVMLVTAATAIGGSTVRDLLLGPAAQPFGWVAAPGVPLVCLAAATAYGMAPSFAGLLQARDYWVKESAELLALASLAAAGTAKAHQILGPTVPDGLTGLAHPLLAALVGTIGTSAGLVIRDLMLGRAPVVLQSGTGLLEAIVAGALSVAAAMSLGAERAWALLLGFLAAALVRAVHVWRNRPRPEVAQS